MKNNASTTLLLPMIMITVMVFLAIFLYFAYCNGQESDNVHEHIFQSETLSLCYPNFFEFEDKTFIVIRHCVPLCKRCLTCGKAICTPQEPDTFQIWPWNYADKCDTVDVK